MEVAACVDHSGRRCERRHHDIFNCNGLSEVVVVVVVVVVVDEEISRCVLKSYT